MNKGQEKAIESLEKAFKRCAKKGLVFYATGDTIIAFPVKYDSGMNIEEIANHEEARHLSIGNAYKDCGML